MTIPLMRQFFREFSYDPDTFEDPETLTEYSYSQAAADAFFEKHQKPDRAHFSVMCGDEIVGDLYLKHIDADDLSCTMSIHMKNDSAKNKGYGSKAEQLALQYAFQELQLETVYADALIRNKRSRHVLDKIGFQEMRRDSKYCYYACRRADWYGIQPVTDIV